MISTVDRQRPTDMLIPSGLWERARALSLSAFAVRPETRRILLIRVRHELELLEQLRRTFGVGVEHAASSNVVDFQSAASGLSDIDSQVSMFGQHELAEWIGASPCIAVPLVPRKPGAGSVVSVGRSRSLDVSLRTRSVSRQHAQFRLEDQGKLELVDCGSRNGSFVNGERLVSGEAARVRGGDEVRFGDVKTLCCPTDLFWHVAQLG